MFFFKYIYRELRRRLGRTLLTAIGLAIGVGLVAAITAVSSGLNTAQSEVLDPLASVGTDLMVNRPIGSSESTQSQGPGVPPIGPQRGAGSRLSAEEMQALVSENQSVVTDLSKLGKPGDKFVHDFFLPATQLTFPSDQADEVSKIDGVSEVATGLTLQSVHQEGTVPEIVAEIQTGGETVTVEEQLSPPSPEEAQQMQACMEKARESGQGDPGGCIPERLRQFRGQFTAPQRTIRQALDPPQTDIASQNYTIAGVDLSTPGLGLLTKDQVTSGSFFTPTTKNEAIVAEGYASRKEISIGDDLKLNETVFKVVGLAKPPLGGQTADVYLTLPELQVLSGREGRINVLLVRAEDAASVSKLEGDIKDSFDGAQVTSAEDVASRVSGTLVDAANLTDRLGLIVSGVMLGAAFLMAMLLSLSSVAKRVRELGTLKAIGWRKWLVVRQVLGESLAQGVLGGILGVGLGFGAAYAIGELAPPLEAEAAASSGTASLFGIGNVAATSKEVITLQAPVELTTVLLALGLAIAGGLLAGAAGAWRAARLRPAAALREVG